MIDILQREEAMYRKVDTLYTQNKTDFDALPHWTDEYPLFQTGIATIDAAYLKQTSYTGTNGKDKALKRTNMETQANLLHIVLNSFAVGTNNADLIKLLNFAPYKVSQGTEQDAIMYCQTIHDAAATNQAGIVNNTYKATLPQITALQTAIDDFKAILPRPQLTIAEQKILTEALEPLFVTQRAHLQKLDTYAGMLLAFNKNDLHALYLDARKIDSSNRHYAFHGHVKDSATKAPIPRATIHVVELDLTAKSGDKAATFHFKTLPDGYYTVEISSPGYQTLTVHVTINNANPTKLDFSLLKI